MIDPSRLLADLQRVLKALEDDVRSRVQESEAIDASLREQHDKAKAASRTAQAYEVWRDDYITQVAVAWILGCVFVRFLEDNGLIETTWLAGPGHRLQLARDQHTLYFQQYPSHSDREYLAHVFDEVTKLPSMRDLLDGDHNPLRKLGPTGDGAHELLNFWQRIEPTTGLLVHDFTDPQWNTRFLGDLYQDLSETARDRYALLQTPEFVEEFILDRTLNPAVREIGYERVRVMDPACGSGHFLLGAFRRLIEIRLHNAPAVPVRAQTQAVLSQIYGLDVNPFAIAIARFRLLVAALRVCAVTQLALAPGFEINLAAGDSLLHGPSPRGLVGVQRALHDDPLQHYYDTEDAERVRQFLSAQYHVVVGNPPYINARDPSLRSAYRTRFATCHGKYQLGVPFTERFFDLTMSRDSSNGRSAGWMGMLVSNAFMKLSFGKVLVESYLCRKNLTHVIDMSGLNLPGHGTPTVILFARNEPPIPTQPVRAVRGIVGISSQREDLASSSVWKEIIGNVDSPGFRGSHVSVSDSDRQAFARHPWAIGGGGAAELKTLLDENAQATLSSIGDPGVQTLTLADDVFVRPADVFSQLGISDTRPFVTGDDVRDWSAHSKDEVFVPSKEPPSQLWPFRTTLSNRMSFGQTQIERDLAWWDYGMVVQSRLEPPVITLACIVTHNHFALCRERRAFNRHALVIRCLNSADDELLGLLGLLNSSVSCFWLKQVCHDKGGGGVGGGLASEPWERFMCIDSAKLKQFPIPSEKPLKLARLIQEQAELRGKCLPDQICRTRVPTREILDNGRERAMECLRRMVSLQEELDWQCYRIYGLIDHDLTFSPERLPSLALGERAFELALARRVANGEAQTSWFERHRSTPVTACPSGWSEDYTHLVLRRVHAIENDGNIALLERPEYKRRWNVELWEELEQQALRAWLLRRIGERRHWSSLELRSCATVADSLRTDGEFQQVAELYRGRKDFDWCALITELVDSESVPVLPSLRYTDPGMRKFSVWTQTWELQRKEDRITAEVQSDATIAEHLKPDVATQRRAEMIGTIPSPPRYEAKDFRKSTYWALRGPLDVPNERFVAFPHCQRDVDPTPVIAWAGWDHLQLARSIAAYYERVKNQEGWTPQRRIPLLASILELMPWLKQWHNEIHPEFQERMGDFFEQFVQDEARAMEITVEQLRAWTPPVQASRGRRRRNS